MSDIKINEFWKQDDAFIINHFKSISEFQANLLIRIIAKEIGNLKYLSKYLQTQPNHLAIKAVQAIKREYGS
ncbi:hypothetical protein [Marinomonas sp. 2405UD68-3]|uniref:hypothetical protein n=1 Tax=Marinomonas sp. 2405UD68-3 TaxID=3391835 RepID=UPI0039C9245E